LSTSNAPLISVVHDDGSVLEAIVSLLESVGYVAAGFISAEDFLNSPHLRRTACLILDVRMPGIGGLELQRRLAAETVLTPIIFITGCGVEKFLREYWEPVRRRSCASPLVKNPSSRPCVQP
jgi:FixJ family two-component response regulator